MTMMTATEARKTFFEIIKQTNQKHEIVQVQHKSGNAIIMSADDYESMQETLHLLSQPDFKKTFTQSVAEADLGEVASFEEVFGEPQ
ncbi:MAG: prevent-host-death protein [Piscirickettsiaceae bacterium CG_4_9_14_3_um_filter_43_564]|nr:type II toxin-antitoxin system Phd/YefM family antitoxin [Thiomicrospira sp.]OIP96266.1 MAG: prevent-host-death protein [Thiomicrospira sp. CG2_30_44_34]PIQ04306.1 MAG: prevent-host-death protein [Piscirickettsiaceae bacterium CG18_big_fil_WC_8_21_14_2_50_44_103]PIU37783.1 MAG: prevent-host-death protein [Piscirickettsiaceae bacterium CG07_land_8_20_14_0_80_44_28]PIW58059.1 MAG: prevent-host-death protein [Piscirickettsiaceae bacterium CG12_big_fil_rev_8_21_14_0_65_44_934]PIW77595.1 MAG: pr